MTSLTCTCFYLVKGEYKCALVQSVFGLIDFAQMFLVYDGLCADRSS